MWRPIKTIYRDPLAVCDGQTVEESDLLPQSIIFDTPGRKNSEAVTVRAPKRCNHQWYFIHEQRPDELLLFKCWDSADGVTRRVPHSAFVNQAMEGREARESVEARALLFF
jgi:hypothetical protein